MTSLNERVACRHLLADTIGDPSNLLAQFQAKVQDFAQGGLVADKLLAHLRLIVDAHGPGAEIRDQGLFWQLDGAWSTTMYGDVATIAVATEYSFRRLRPIGHNLFLAILQQFALPPALTKKVQACARFWSKGSIRAPKVEEKWWPRNANWVVAFPKFLKEYETQIGIAKEALAKGKAHGAEGSTTKMNAGPFTLINTANFDDQVMSNAVEVVEKAAKLLQGIGLGKVCYGDILVSATITNNSNVAAFYLPSKDEMFVRANIKGDPDTVRVVCHELAHRLEHKFLKGKAREIAGLYQRLAIRSKYLNDADPKDFPPIGKEIQYEGRKLEVIRVDYGKKTVTFRDEKDTNPKGLGILPNPNAAWVTPLATWKTKYEGTPAPPSTEMDFVTPYAKKSPGENFAEMVSFYAVGRLSDAQLELLKPILE